jgi:hypothetical protein
MAANSPGTLAYSGRKQRSGTCIDEHFCGQTPERHRIAAGAKLTMENPDC